MVQSSITAWLRRPQTAQSKDNVNLQQLPTPPPERGVTSSPDEGDPRQHAISNATSPNAAISFSTPESLKLFSSLHSLPSNITLESLTPALLPSFKRLNALLLPVPYTNSFYAETLSDSTISSLSLVALWHPDPPISFSSQSTKPILAGAMRCRLLPPGTSESGSSGAGLYISTIATLSPYRGHGIASHLLARVTRTAVEKYEVTEVTAHVWVGHEESLEWYGRRGFREVRREEGYYKRLRPATAVLLIKRVGVADLLRGNG